MDKDLQEIILSERKAIELDMKDDELVRLIDTRINEARSVKDKIDTKADKNEKYWLGNQLDLTKIPESRSKAVDNKIYMATETMVPILTSSVPEPEIEGPIDNEIRDQIQQMLKLNYEIIHTMPAKLREFARNWMIGYVGVLKYRWDKQKGFQTETVNWRKIGFDPVATRLNECDFVYEWMDSTLKELTERFPDAKDKIIKRYGKDKLGSKVRYVEYWGNGGEWVCWKLKDIVLDKMKNPNWDYNGKNNILKKQIFPYIVGKYFSTNKSIYDETSVIEQAIPIQDLINKRKNQISDMCDMNKRFWIASSVAISREDFQKFVNQVGERGLYVEGGDIAQIQQLLGKMDQSYFNDLVQSTSEIDNIFGTHSTTRGERQGRETALGRQILFQSDLGRMAGIVEDVIEQTIEDWYNILLHMYKVYSRSGLKYEDGSINIDIPRDAIPDNAVVLVKKGTSTPLDRASRIQLAMQQAQLDRIDPETQYEELGYPKARERAEKLKAWLREEGKLAPTEAAQEEAGKKEATDVQDSQMMRLQNIMSSERFKALGPEEQQAFIEQARQVVAKIKGEEPAGVSAPVDNGLPPQPPQEAQPQQQPQQKVAK